MALKAPPFTSTAASRIDPVELRQGLNLLMSPGGAHEVRGLPSGRSRLVRPGQIEAAIRAVEALASDRGLYITINPVRADFGEGAAKNSDIAERHYLFVDLDPIRPKDTCATDAEHAAAGAVAEAIHADLVASGWPAPIVIDSGNGWYLIFRVDLPNTPLSRQIIKGCLMALAARYNSDAAVIDPTVHNAARIARLPGTWNRKGEDTKERPHRLCRLASRPVTLESVPVEKLRALAGDLAEGPKASTQTFEGKGDPYARSALEREVGKVATAGEERNVQLHLSAVKLGGYVAAGRLDEAEVRAKLTAAARAAGLPDPADPTEIERAISNGLAHGMETPKHKGEPEQEKAKARAEAEAVMEDAADDLIIWGNEVVPKDVDWLWTNRVPFGFITIFAGRTGVGKSFVTCYLVARHTAGMDLPDSNGEALTPGHALIISEDPPDTMLAPRLIELGADMRRVAFMTWKAMAAYTLSDIEMLQKVWEKAKQPELVMIDPPTNFLSGVDEHKNVEVRRILMNLVAWLQEKRVACILITHLNKQVGKGIDAMSRIIGSVAWGTTARIAHTFAPHPDKADECVFATPKNNLGPIPMALGYRIVPTDTFATLEWTGVVDMTADEAMGGQGRTRKVAASEWLVERFREKLEWPSDELFERAREDGVSRNAVFEAKDVLLLPRARQVVYPDGSRKFVWWVAPDWPKLRDDANGTVGQCDTTPY